MSSIGQPSEPVVFESFKQPDYFDRSQYAPQQGSSYTQLHEAPQEMESSGGSRVQFDVVFVGDAKVSLSPGYVRNINPSSAADSPIIDWMPTLEGVPLSNDPSPEITVASGQVLYCEVPTTNKGVVIAAPTITLGEPQQTGTHYQPPQLNPVDGSLRFPIASFEERDGDLVAIQIQQGGPILVQPNLWEGKNIGGERELYKERQNADDLYEFRTLKQQMADPTQEGLAPVAVLKPKPDGGEEDTIKVRFLSERPSSGSGSGEAQIKVTETEGGDGIIIRGNDEDVDVSGAFLTSFNARDGLVTGPPATEPFGIDAEISIIDGCGTRQHNLKFRKGLLSAYNLTTISP